MNNLKIICFSCKFSWGYLEEEAKLAAEIKNWVPIICAGKLDAEYVVNAFLRGADGVLILACPQGDCHYQDGNIEAEKRMALLKQALLTQGIEPQRVKMVFSRDPSGRDIQAYIDEFARTIALIEEKQPSKEMV